MSKQRLNPTFTGELTADQWFGRRVVAFGDVRIDDAIPTDKVWRMADPAADGQALFNKGVRPEDLVDGFAFVVPEQLSGPDAAAVVEVQKALIFLHYKYIDFPKNSLSTADTAGVREEPLPDVIREINQLRNYPWLLSSPIADKLAAKRLGLPLMVLLPGPSVREVLPRLKTIREKCLIACVARTLHDCLDAGVHPDVVLQLDTYQVQRNFYEGIPDLPETLLVPLSICPFYPYAHKFRGVVMMDSFNLDLLPNPARLRESYVSSITACLGLAEALHSPHAYIAGANLSYPAERDSHPYTGQTDGPKPVFAEDETYILEARNGAPIRVKDYFIATAREAEQFAMEIAQTSGTRFHSTTDSTLLPRQWFPHAPVEQIETLPELDRTAYLDAVDDVLDRRETVNITKTRMKLLKELSEMRQIETAFTSGTVPRETLENHVLTRAARKMRNPRLLGNVDVVGVAARLSTKWRESLNNARLLVQAFTQAGQGKPLPLLCLEDEAESLTKRLGDIVEDARWELFSPYTPPLVQNAEATQMIVDNVMDWLAGQRVVFASPRIMTEFSYVMDYVPSDNVYDLRAIVGSES